MKHMLLAGLLLAVPGVVAAQDRNEPPPRTLSVTATGTVEREPDQARISLAVVSEAQTAREASQANATLMEQVVSGLKQAGIPDNDIRTVSYQLHPIYAPPDSQDRGEPRITGYRAQNMVEVLVDSVARVGAIVDASIAAGANRVTGLSFELRDYEDARLEALDQAVAKARREAEALAKASGQTLGPPLSISTSTGGPPPPRPMFDAAMAMRAEATPVEGGTLTVNATVSIVYQLGTQ